ncbi:MAG: phosphatase PAP2 family protein [Peptococcaceae bacterium]|nr:phosphatase PAP2 family protein [Peptococcaceae bacterium]
MALNQWELTLLDRLADAFHCGFLDAVMPALTFLGDGGWFWILLACLLLLRKPTRRMGLTVGLALLLSLLVGNIILKPLVARIRPFDLNEAIQLLIPPPGDFSFPSGHTQASFAAATAIYCYHKRAGRWCLALAALIGFSRLYLYAHYPSDVLAGLVIGVALGAAAYRLSQLIFLKSL